MTRRVNYPQPVYVKALVFSVRLQLLQQSQNLGGSFGRVSAGMPPFLMTLVGYFRVIASVRDWTLLGDDSLEKVLGIIESHPSDRAAEFCRCLGRDSELAA
jgi:hypothetical protein